jgi:hypothetical protein
LFHDREPNRAHLFRALFQDSLAGTAKAAVRIPRTRPAYTEATLAVSLREATDPNGRRLHPLMPRYAMSDRDLSDLTAYLRSLGSEAAPGIDETTIHFATVESDVIAPRERRALTARRDREAERRVAGDAVVRGRQCRSSSCGHDAPPGVPGEGADLSVGRNGTPGRFYNGRTTLGLSPAATIIREPP